MNECGGMKGIQREEEKEKGGIGPDYPGAGRAWPQNVAGIASRQTVKDVTLLISGSSNEPEKSQEKGEKGDR